MDHDYFLPNLLFFVSPISTMFLSLFSTSVCSKFILLKFILEDSFAPGGNPSGQTAKGSNFLSPVIYPQKHSQK